MIQELLGKYEGNIERLGFILATGEIVEFTNVCSKPSDGFEASGEDILLWEDQSVASWHTHPGQSANLSSEDSTTFKLRPDWIHYIVGDDGVRAYRVENGRVVNHEL